LLKSSAQSTIDYLILTGIILIVVLPLLMFSNQRLDATRESQITDAVNIVENAVTELINLGYGSATERVVQIPSGIEYSLIENNNLILGFKGRELIYQFAYNIAGIFPINQGRHYIKLFNNGTYIIFSICGNNIIESPEQCDGTATPLGFECYPPGSPNACKLKCTPPLSCPFGYECVNDVCTILGFCGNGIPENFEQCDDGNINNGDGCSSTCQLEYCGDNSIQIGLGEECDPPSSSCTTSGGSTGTCNILCQCVPTIPPPPPTCNFNPSTASCTGSCSGGGSCISTGVSCTCCGNNVINPGEVCDPPTNVLGANGQCSLTEICSNSCQCATPPSPICPSSVMGYWHFDDNPPNPGTSYFTPILDSSCNGYNGQLFNVQFVSPPYSGYYGISALKFIGDPSDAISHIIFSTLDFPPQGTLEIIVKSDQWSGTISNVLSFASSYYSSPSPPYTPYGNCFGLFHIPNDPSTANANKIAATFNGDTFNAAYTNSGINLDVHHVAITWTPSQSILYIDGQPQSTIGTTIADCYKPFYIGYPPVSPAGSPAWGGTSFVGVIDEVILFDQPLSDSDIQMHYNNFITNQPYCIVSVCVGT